MYLVGPFGDRFCDGNDVHFLEGILTQKVCRYIAGNGNHGGRVAVGIGNAGYQISCTGSRCRQTNTDATADTRVSLSRVNRTLFMLGADTADVVFTQDVENFKIGAAWISKYRVYSLCLECFG